MITDKDGEIFEGGHKAPYGELYSTDVYKRQSQPSTETMFYALGQYGIETGLNEDVINKVNDYFKPIKQKYVCLLYTSRCV